VNRDFVEMLSALAGERAEFLIVGAHALAAHGVPRATGDLDIWVNTTSDNATIVLRKMTDPRFTAPVEARNGKTTIPVMATAMNA